MTRYSHTSRHEGLRRKLTPWADALRGRLSLPINDPAPHSSDLVEKLWIHLNVPEPESVRDDVQWVQALRLLDLFAGIDRLACWELIIDLCDAHEKLHTLGCPIEFFMDVRPRFELRFDKIVTPTIPPPEESLAAVRVQRELRHGERPASCDDVVALFCSGGSARRARSGDDDFSRLETELVGGIHESLGAPLDPTPIRCFVTIRRSVSCFNCRRSRCDEPVVELLNQVLACANRVAAQETTKTTPFDVQSFSFDLRGVCDTARVHESLREIGCKVPFDTFKSKGFSNSLSTKSYAPFVWRLVAPHDNVRANLGVRRLDVLISYERLSTAIHSSRTLEELRVDSGFWSADVAFALFSKTAQHKIHTVELTWEAPGCYSVVEQNKFRDIKYDVNETQHGVAWPPVAARVNAQTKVQDSPVNGRVRSTTTVYHGKRPVDCLVVEGDDETTTKLLVPGVGVTSVTQKDVISLSPAPVRDTHTIRNFTINMKSSCADYYKNHVYPHPFSGASVAALLRIVGEPLERLTIVCVGERPTTATCVDDILEHCPNLKRLKIVNVTLSAEQLFSSKHARALQSLTLITCHLIDKPRRMGSAFYVAPHSFPRLTSLYFDSSGAAENDKVTELATLYDYILELATRRKLHRLVVKCGDLKQRARFAKEIARFDGNVIPVIPLREKLAFLSVVTVGASASKTAKYVLGMGVAHLVFEFASTAAWHRRVWTLLM